MTESQEINKYSAEKQAEIKKLAEKADKILENAKNHYKDEKGMSSVMLLDYMTKKTRATKKEFFMTASLFRYKQQKQQELQGVAKALATLIGR
jgi:tRNA C32,U32 (ribose-2'-O)-methylase TrmJ